ncbi:MAG: TonB-dependent receptor [Cytophagales bacterium]|nr:TonB-dependent receptor [Cytophagales bacterium]MDW8383201.1 TonB-dependent receptor [Flammeovirgaceae bacterium]
MEHKPLSSKEKALQINLDEFIYGSFAEIGAGQDTAAIFFKAGGASGTVAKTMSAYDMAFSDAIYGPEENKRYVCKPRLLKMLEKEYSLLPKRLPHRADRTCFFAFANTVEALNFKRTNEGHGWVGVRFQTRPNGPVNDCIIHVKMKDNDPVWQQNALGIVGVNLIYACFYYRNDIEVFMKSLLDEVTIHRIEIDYFELRGDDFNHIDNRLLSLKLVRLGLTNITMFDPDGNVLHPADALYKKNVMIVRGRFRPVTLVNMDMIQKGKEQFYKDPEVDKTNTVIICELTLDQLAAAGNQDGNIDERDFLYRADILCSLGQTVMISNVKHYYRLVPFLSKLTRGKKIGIVLGVYNLLSLFDEKNYDGLKGGILESFGTLFSNNVKMFVYPSYKPGTKEIVNVYTLELPPTLIDLLEYLVVNNKVEDIKDYVEEHLDIISDNVLAQIKKGEEGWEKLVPEGVASIIKSRCLFDYPCKVEPQID